jgi:hypothetical protein
MVVAFAIAPERALDGVVVDVDGLVLPVGAGDVYSHDSASGGFDDLNVSASKDVRADLLPVVG